MTRLIESTAAILRARIRDAVNIGALRPGDRLPGSRALASELGVDPRVVAAALRQLGTEGTVEVRQRSGTYIAGNASPDDARLRLPGPWAAGVLAEAVRRGVPTHRLSAAIAKLIDTHGLRAGVIAPTGDQTLGIVRELRDGFGMAAAAIHPEQLARLPHPHRVTRSHVLFTTGRAEPLTRQVAASSGKPVIAVEARPDLFSEDWITLMRSPAYAVVGDVRFRDLLHTLLKSVPGGGNVEILLAGRDDLSRIPPAAPTYVTESARQILGRAWLPGRLLPPRRMFSERTVREIIAFLISFNERRDHCVESEAS